VLFWIFIVGGIIDRYARNRPVRSHGFFSASGVFFFRFLRLAVFAWIGYGVLFGYVHRWLFEWLYLWVTRDFTVERSAFIVRVVLYLVFGVLLLALNMLFDYAKIRAVVEDRRSMIGALVAAIVVALGIGLLSRQGTIKEDTAIGILFAGALSLGVALISTIKTYAYLRDITDRKRFEKELKIPIYVFCDMDVYGYYIYSVYKQGSINLAFFSEKGKRKYRIASEEGSSRQGLAHPKARRDREGKGIDFQNGERAYIKRPSGGL
jgi:hypothetical protein